MPSVVARELKQKKPFASPEQEVVVGLRMASARVMEPWAQYLKANARLTTNQYNVLRVLRGSHPARLACSDIADRMIERDPDITRLLDRLETRGLVKRGRSREDRRVVEVGITDKGLELVRGLDAEVQRLPRVLLGHLGAERVRQLATLLDTLIEGLATTP